MSDVEWALIVGLCLFRSGIHERFLRDIIVGYASPVVVGVTRSLFSFVVPHDIHRDWGSPPLESRIMGIVARHMQGRCVVRMTAIMMEDLLADIRCNGYCDGHPKDPLMPRATIIGASSIVKFLLMHKQAKWDWVRISRGSQYVVCQLRRPNFWLTGAGMAAKWPQGTRLDVLEPSCRPMSVGSVVGYLG